MTKTELKIIAARIQELDECIIKMFERRKEIFDTLTLDDANTVSELVEKDGKEHFC